MAVDISQRLAQADTVRPDRVWDEKGTGGHLMYWKKPERVDEGGNPMADSGWVVVGQSSETEYVRQSEKGMRPLSRYGHFNHENPRIGWTVAQDPYRQILQRDGAHEFPAAQIVELGWHRRPPIPGLTFPQLAGVEIEDIQCPICHKWFMNQACYEKHERVAHADIAGQQALSRSLAKAQETVQAPLADVLRALVANQAQMGRVVEALAARLGLTTTEIVPDQPPEATAPEKSAAGPRVPVRSERLAKST
ncbi:MAG: hypothetical protein QG671_3507 [Actinomycetota bacterium]|nr:hypothetical protein [Actinomycetota bacterium]